MADPNGDGDSPDTTADGDENGDALDDAEFQANFATPDARAKEARDGALDALSTIPDDPSGSEIVAAMDAESSAVTTWAKHAAMAAEDGFPDARVEAAAKVLSSECSSFTKKNLVGLVDDQRARLRKHRASSSSGLPVLDEWIDDNLERVVRVETTDAVQDTRFRWDFADGTIETSKTKDGITHFSWSHFRDEIYEGLGVNTAKPMRREAEEWREWISHLVEQRGEVKSNFGPRSAAVEKVQEFVRDSVAFGKKGDASERGGVYIDDDPAGNPTELCVMGTDIKRICDDQEIDVRALQQELDARGHTHDRLNGVSEGEYAAGRTVRYWVLDPDFATPAGYMEEADTPAQVAQQQQNQGSGSSGTPSAVGPAAMGTDGAKLASIGPDGDVEQADEDSSDDTDDEHSRTDANDGEQAGDEQPRTASNDDEHDTDSDDGDDT
jgi:hypothetical protein